MSPHGQEETKRPRKSKSTHYSESESEEEVPRKRSKSSELNIERIGSVYDLIEELQNKEKNFYSGIQRQLQAFHLSQQERYHELMGDVKNIKLRLLGEKVPKLKYEATSRRGSFSTDKSSLQSDYSSVGSPSTQPRGETPRLSRKARSQFGGRSKAKSPFTPGRVASSPPESPSILIDASPITPPPLPPSPSTKSPPPPPPPQSERALRNLPKRDYKLKLTIEGDDEFVPPPPKHDGSDDEFFPNSILRDHEDDEPSPASPTKLTKRGKSKPRKSINGQKLLKGDSKDLETISKSIGKPGMAKKETVQMSLGPWLSGRKEDGKPSCRTASPKRSTHMPLLPSSSPPLSPAPTLPAPPPSPPPQPVVTPISKWRAVPASTR